MKKKTTEFRYGRHGNFRTMTFTIPNELIAEMQKAAYARGMNRSAYVVYLIKRDLDLIALEENAMLLET